MATLSEIIAQELSQNTELSALLTGGVFYSPPEISKQLTPEAFDQSTLLLKPCCLVKVQTTTPVPDTSAIFQTNLVSLFLYQYRVSLEIDQAVVLIHSILHNLRIPPVHGVKGFEFRFTSSTLGTYEEVLDCQLHVLRYSINTTLRGVY